MSAYITPPTPGVCCVCVCLNPAPNYRPGPEAGPRYLLLNDQCLGRRSRGGEVTYEPICLKSLPATYSRWGESSCQTRTDRSRMQTRSHICKRGRQLVPNSRHRCQLIPKLMYYYIIQTLPTCLIYGLIIIGFIFSPSLEREDWFLARPMSTLIGPLCATTWIRRVDL